MSDPTSNAPRFPVSVIILTKNEEINLAECLDCLKFSDDVVVYDSFSTDKTLEIARSYPNVRVIQRTFDNWASHQNWGVTNIEFKHPWVLYVDADERVPPELADEVGRAASPDSPHAAYRMRRKDMFLGRWLQRAQLYPTWLVRLFRPNRIRYERLVNPIAIVDGSTGELAEHLIHYPFRKGIRPWLDRHNSYSTLESQESLRGRDRKLHISGVFSSDPNVRRAAMKEVFFRMPLRPLVRFLYLFLFRRGFLDGVAGFHYSVMISMYEYWIDLKVREANPRRQRSSDVQFERLTALIRDDSAPEAAGGDQPLVEVLIPTLNEAAHIQEAVENAKRLGPVFVLDSMSTDGTQELARQAGATVVEHRFENYSRQKNWGLDNMPFKGSWIFILDADERITPNLREEIERAVTRNDGTVGFFVNRIVIFMGKKIRHGGLFPSWNLRLFRRGSCRYEDRSVHEHMLANGPTGYLDHLMLHIRRETISQYIAKHIRYADMESNEWLKARLGQGGGAKADLLFRNALRWRQWARRSVWPRLPFKPMIRLLYMYFLRLGFLDGLPGWHLACLMANYEYMIALQYKEKLLGVSQFQAGTKKS